MSKKDKSYLSDVPPYPGAYSGYNSDEPCKSFAPHAFETKVEAVVPTVFFTPQVLADMKSIVDACDIEVGWLGLVDQKPGGDLVVSEIFVPKQKCNAAMAKITPNGLMDLYSELSKRPNGDKLVEKILFWGHSHVRMGTSPSGQDDDTMEIFKKGKCPYFVRAILNKEGRMEISLFYFEQGLVVNDAPWFVEYDAVPDRAKHWKSIIRNNVKEEKCGYSSRIPPLGNFHAQGREGRRSWPGFVAGTAIGDNDDGWAEYGARR